MTAADRDHEITDGAQPTVSLVQTNAIFREPMSEATEATTSFVDIDSSCKGTMTDIIHTVLKCP